MQYSILNVNVCLVIYSEMQCNDTIQCVSIQYSNTIQYS